MEKKLKKTIVKVEVLMEPEDSLENMSLQHIEEECLNGAWSYQFETESETILEGEEAERACEEQGTDPSFFFYE
jgi:hypothetical protein